MWSWYAKHLLKNQNLFVLTKTKSKLFAEAFSRLFTKSVTPTSAYAAFECPSCATVNHAFSFTWSKNVWVTLFFIYWFLQDCDYKMVSSYHYSGQNLMKVQLIVQVINKIWTYEVFWPDCFVRWKKINACFCRQCSHFQHSGLDSSLSFWVVSLIVLQHMQWWWQVSTCLCIDLRCVVLGCRHLAPTVFFVRFCIVKPIKSWSQKAEPHTVYREMTAIIVWAVIYSLHFWNPSKIPPVTVTMNMCFFWQLLG